MDAATLVYDIDSSQAVGAAKALAQMGRAAADAATDSAKLERTYRGVDGRFIKTADAARENAAAIRSLADEFNPLLSSQLKFAQAEQRAADAVRLGVLSKEQASVLLPQLAAQYDAAAMAQQRFGAGAEVASHHAMNLGYQLNDIGMMMALGQNPFALMMQQGPQVAQIFSQMNAEGRKIGPTLLSAFTSILNPTTLVTLALIGGAAAFTQWAFSGRDASTANTDFLDSITGLAEAANSYSAALSTAGQNSFALTAQYGAQAQELQRIYDLNVQLEQIKLGNSIRDAAMQANAAYGDLAARIAKINDLIDYGARNEMVRENALNAARLEMAMLNDEYGMSLGLATDLNDALQAMSKASTMEEQAIATEAFAQALLDAHRNGAIIPPELIRIASEAGVAAAAIREIAAASHDAASAWASVGQNTGTFITGYEMPEMPDAPSGGRGGRGGGGGRSSSGGGGGGGLSAADQLRDEMQKRYEALAEGFQAEYALAMQNYTRDQETLQFALDNKLISLQQYEQQKAMLYTQTWGTEFEQQTLQYQLDQVALQSALEQKLISHEDYYRRLKELQYANLMSEVNRSDMAQDLSNTAAYFGQLNSLTGNNYDKLGKLQKTFAASAALVNAYLAASQTLADPTLGFWGKMAAYGTVLAAGLGLVGAIKSGGGGGGRGGGAGGATAAPAATQAPVQNVLVNLTGDQWLVDMAGEVIDQISEQSRNGRVIIQRDRN